ncbi:VOC family protein [Rhodococcus sp. D2-41]|uniref:VOC family protein n=1 Tax=Speluncibacter jeojiensis TaxID=2710754 RepID=A0A9X4M2U9_9ACTN|nr:VOC family protein [Rhodococcus sp. D2-41]MDG3009146.1 VOC family protein [Rhodococcus sp. D2-41]MDG3016181.1 VOC family protein [Corynebacteriales bacterium D3-21]
MGATLNPYLSFRDTALRAMEFYQSVFGGDLIMTTFGQFQMGDESEKDKVMHSMLTTPGGMVLMASDTPAGMDYTPGTNYSVSLSGEDEAELRRYWDKLSDGGTVAMPLNKAPWGDTFGMCVDRFGVSWLVNIAGEPES